MRVDESLVLKARRKDRSEAIAAAREVAESFGTRFTIGAPKQVDGPDGYGTCGFEVPIYPDWRGFDGS